MQILPGVFPFKYKLQHKHIGSSTNPFELLIIISSFWHYCGYFNTKQELIILLIILPVTSEMWVEVSVVWIAEKESHEELNANLIWIIGDECFPTFLDSSALAFC